MHPMKKILLLFALLAAVAGAYAALPQPDLIAQIHFAGAQKISADPNSLAFTNEFCSAEAVTLRTQTAGRLAVFLDGWLRQNVNAAAPAGVTGLAAVLGDLTTAEWFLESRASAGGRPEVALAVKLAAERAQAWQTGLKPYFPAAVFRQVNGWLIFESGTGTQKLADGLAPKISGANAGWLALDVNWPRLAQWFPQLKALALPEMQFTVTARDGNLHTDGKWLFPENLALTLEPWRMPTNSIHQPFDSFTAVRGWAGWLQTQSWAQPWLVSPTPNQLFVWALPQVPFQTFAAEPVPDAAVALEQIQSRLLPVFSGPAAVGKFLMPITLALTNKTLAFHGAPFVAPYMHAVSEPAGQFLLAGGFPNTPRSKPLPPELFQRLAEKNLVLYHWEITAQRLPQVLNMSQFGLMMTLHRQLSADTAAFKWIQKIGPALGNNVTEITQTGPAEMTFARKSNSGFTAVELYALANWLEAPDFPGCNLKQPPRRPLNFKHLPPKTPGALPAPGMPLPH